MTSSVDANKLLEAGLLMCKETASFIQGTVYRPIENLQSRREPYSTAAGLLARCTLQLRTLAKLSPPDFQTIVGASRSLFEIAVDSTLMATGDDWYAPEHFQSWEWSAKLDACDKARKYHDEVGSEHAGIALGRDDIPDIRIRLTDEWRANRTKKGKHPSRWTGKDLRTDARQAEMRSGESLWHWYSTEYPMACWYTHGSNLAGIRDQQQNTLTGMAALALVHSCRFAGIAARNLAELTEVMDTSMTARFERLKTKTLIYQGQGLGFISLSNDGSVVPSQTIR